jgi:hypothetical protein
MLFRELEGHLRPPAPAIEVKEWSEAEFRNGSASFISLCLECLCDGNLTFATQKRVSHKRHVSPSANYERIVHVRNHAAIAEDGHVNIIMH